MKGMLIILVYLENLRGLVLRSKILAWKMLTFPGVVTLAFAGAFCGWNYDGSKITNCYSTGSVSGRQEIGGLCGRNYSGTEIKNCYSTASVSGDYEIGGLCGWNWVGSIINCYSISTISGVDRFGGIVGTNSGTITSSYFLDVPGSNNGAGTPLTDTQMKQQSSYVGWDFVDMWDIREGLGYLYLRFEASFAFRCTKVKATWMGGNKDIYNYPVYGTKGVAAPANKPGARSSSVSWTDADGDLWLFGGYGYDSAGGEGRLNDLWKYDTSTGLWTWVSGDSTVDNVGVYGTQGVAARATNRGQGLAAFPGRTPTATCGCLADTAMTVRAVRAVSTTFGNTTHRPGFGRGCPETIR